MNICPFLSHHLPLLDSTDAALGVEYDDPGSRNICKSSHRRLAGISGSGSQDYDLIRHSILRGRSRHKMREYGERHILERDGRSVEQFQVPYAVGLFQAGDLRNIELAVIGSVYAVLQFLFCIVGKEQAHDLQRSLLIALRGQHFPVLGIARQFFGNKQSSVRRKSLQNSLGCCYSKFGTAGAPVHDLHRIKTPICLLNDFITCLLLLHNNNRNPVFRQAWNDTGAEPAAARKNRTRCGSCLVCTYFIIMISYYAAFLNR